MNQNASLAKRIEIQYSELSSSAQGIANYLQLHPMAIVSMSVTELGKATATSKATVSRFFRQLGYSSHLEAKQLLLAKRESGFPIASADNSQNGTAKELEQELNNVEHTFNGLTEDLIQGISLKLAHAKRVILLGYRNSYPLALTFSQQLKQIRADVQLMPTPAQTIAEDIVGLQNDDFIILLGFRRRPRIFDHLVRGLEDKEVLLLTDPSGQIYNQSVKHLIVCQLGERQAFDSYAAPMAVITLLCNRVYEQLGEAGQRRTSRISDLYDSFNELS